MVTAPSECIRDPALIADFGARAQGFADLFHPRFLGRDKAEPVSADDGTGLADKAVADLHTRADPRALQDQGVTADLRACRDRDMAGDARTGADLHALADGDKGADGSSHRQ